MTQELEKPEELVAWPPPAAFSASRSSQEFMVPDSSSSNLSKVSWGMRGGSGVTLSPSAPLRGQPGLIPFFPTFQGKQPLPCLKEGRGNGKKRTL